MDGQIAIARGLLEVQGAVTALHELQESVREASSSEDSNTSDKVSSHQSALSFKAHADCTGQELLCVNCCIVCVRYEAAEIVVLVLSV